VSSAQLPFYSLAATATTLPPELLVAVEALTGINPAVLKPTITMSAAPSNVSSTTPTEDTIMMTESATVSSTTVKSVPKLAPPKKPIPKRAKKGRFLNSRSVLPSRMAMKLVSEPIIEGAWPDEQPLPAYAPKGQTKERADWVRDSVLIGLMATRSVVNAFTHSEPWVYKALQSAIVGVLCLNILMGCINVGHQLVQASFQLPYAQQLAAETQTHHKDIEQSLTSLKKGEGVEMLARGYMDMVEPNQVLVKIR
jgi:hypothetical protein